MSPNTVVGIYIAFSGLVDHRFRFALIATLVLTWPDDKNWLERARQFHLKIFFIALAPPNNQPGTGDAKNFKHARSQLIACMRGTEGREIITPFRLLAEGVDKHYGDRRMERPGRE